MHGSRGQSAYVGEKGKNLARKEDLDKILVEVHSVTEAQKRIEARISGEMWHQQWVATERRNAYVLVIKPSGNICKPWTTTLRKESSTLTLSKLAGLDLAKPPTN
jgi:hypothetical protein